MKLYSVILVIREIEMKTTMKYHYTPTKLKGLMTFNPGDNMEQQELS